MSIASSSKPAPASPARAARRTAAIWSTRGGPHGVGSGNAPALIFGDADPEAAARAVVSSKTFDHGVICGSEQHLVVERSLVDRFTGALRREAAAVSTGRRRRRCWGRCSTATAARCSSATPAAPLRRSPTRRGSPGTPRSGCWSSLRRRATSRRVPRRASGSRRSSRSSWSTASTRARSCAGRLLAVEGAGHTAAIHTRSRERVARFGRAMPVSRILVNLPGRPGLRGDGQRPHPLADARMRHLRR